MLKRYTTVFSFWGTVKPDINSRKSRRELRELTKTMSRKESQTQQEKSEISNDWREIYGVKYSQSMAWDLMNQKWQPSEIFKLRKMCKLSHEVFTKGFRHSETSTRFDMRKKSMTMNWQRAKVIWWNKTTTNNPTDSELLWCKWIRDYTV